MRRLFRGRKVVVGIAVTSLLIAAAGVAYAAIPDSSGAINSCYRNGSGTLRVVDAASECGANETALQLGGPTRGYAHSDSSFDPLTADHWTPVVEVQLPGGKYLLHGKLNVMNQAVTPIVVICAITTTSPGTIHLWDQSWLRVDGWDGHAFPTVDVVLQTPLVLETQTTVQLQCIAGEPTTSLTARYRQLDAIQVDALAFVREHG